MAEATLDLTDDQIEKLLYTAEVSLANRKPSEKAVAVKSKQQQLATLGPGISAPAPAQLPKSDSEVDKDAVKRSEELSLRVPKLKSKDKKVCSPTSIVHSFLSHMMKTYPIYE